MLILNGGSRIKNANPEASKNSADENVTTQTTLALPRTTGTLRLSHVRIYECDTRVIITFRVYGLMSVRGGGGRRCPAFCHRPCLPRVPCHTLLAFTHLLVFNVTDLILILSSTGTFIYISQIKWFLFRSGAIIL